MSATKKTSLLLVIDGLEFGGGERVFLQLAERLKDHFPILVASTPGGTFEKQIKNIGIRFFPVDMGRQLSLRPICQIRKIIQEHQIGFLHSQGARADFFSRIAGVTAGVPHNICTLAMPVEGFDIGRFKKGVYRLVDNLTQHCVDRFIVVSDALKQMLIDQRGIPANRIARIYNGIELKEYCHETKGGNFRKEWGTPFGTPLIGAVGRMVWQKGFKYLVQAIPQILSQEPGAKFLFVGDGPLRPHLEELACDLHVSDSVTFTGFRTDIKSILSSLDMVVIPSVLEGLPIITLEAMAMAKPIIASRIDGIDEQISHQQEGVLIPPKDPEAIAEAVLNLIRNNAFSTKIGIAARKRVESCFSVETMISETEKLYLSLAHPES